MALQTDLRTTDFSRESPVEVAERPPLIDLVGYGFDAFNFFGA